MSAAAGWAKLLAVATKTMNGTGLAGPMVRRIEVATLDELPVGGKVSVLTDDGMIGVFRLPDGIYALDDLCPHMAESLASGSLDERGAVVTCPAHGWRFDVRNGRSPDYEGIQVSTYPVEVVDGVVYVKLQETTRGGAFDDAWLDREDDPDPDDIEDMPFD